MPYDQCLEDVNVEIEVGPSNTKEINAPPASRAVEGRLGHNIREKITEDM